MKFAIQIDVIKHFLKDDEAIDLIENNKDKSMLLLPDQTNKELLDSCLCFPPDKLHFEKSDTKVQSLEIKPFNPTKTTLMMIQIKKDFFVFWNKYEEIKSKWEEKKEVLTKKFPNKYNMVLLLLSHEDGSEKLRFGKDGWDDLLIGFADTQNKDFFYP